MRWASTIAGILVVLTAAGCGAGESADDPIPPDTPTSTVQTSTTSLPSTTSAPESTEGTIPSTLTPSTTSTLPAAQPTTAPTTATPISPTTRAPSGDLPGVTVLLDPGHNGRNWAHRSEISTLVDIGNRMKECDTTGTATYGGYSESAFNLDVVLRTKVLLEQTGATVVLTRVDDAGWGPCISERAALGNEAGADVAISVHADGGPDGGRGFHVIYPAPLPGLTDDIAADSERLALILRDTYAERTGAPTADYIGVGGLSQRDDLGGLNLSDVPKVFLEAGNMRNGADAALLSDPAFRQTIAVALAETVSSYLQSS